jgi:amidohydrolase
MIETKDEILEKFDRLVAEVKDSAIEVRRHLHRNPEVGWKEHKTQAFLESWLKERGITTRKAAQTGLVVELGKGKNPVLYRADIDALPIQDTKQPGGAKCVSHNPGVSHACGHDLHSSVAAGLASALHKMEDDLPHPVRIIFQPAEEVLPSGAAEMRKEGLFDDIRAALALHADPIREVGSIGVRIGQLTATSDGYKIKVQGESGHSARPHLAKDAMLAASDVVRTLYGLTSQTIDPLEPAVLNVGLISGGDAANIIAGEVELSGVVRTLSAESRKLMHKEIRSAAEAAARVHGCSATVEIQLGSPPIVNDPRIHELIKSNAIELLGRPNVQAIPHPSTGAEDFGQISACAPSYMIRLGVRSPGGPIMHLHTEGFDLDESAIEIAMRVMGRTILRSHELDLTQELTA